MIKTERLSLWHIEPSDLIQNYQWANDMDLCRRAGSLPMPRSMNDLEGWYREACSDPETSIFSVKLHDSTHIGNIELRELDLRCGCSELGIMIGDRKFRGKGYGSEAVKALCGFAFSQLRLHRISVRVLEFNEPAFHMFKKCGFTHEGTQREAFWLDGRYWDIRFMSLLEKEFCQAIEQNNRL